MSPGWLARRRLLSLAVFLSAAGCAQEHVTSDLAAMFDPQLVDGDASSFRQSFDGEPADLVLGTGWYGSERGGEAGDWSSFSWASQTATLYFGGPLVAEMEVAARCAPFIHPASPTQSLTAFLNGQPVAVRALSKGWQEVRFALPPGLLRAPINVLELRFANAVAPAAVSASTDIRRLAATFAEIAVLPRGCPLERPISAVRPLGDARQELLVAGGGLMLPLPAGRKHRVELGAVRASSPGLEVAVSVVEPGGSEREIGRVAPGEASPASLEFAPRSEPERLLFRVKNAAGAPAPPDATVSLKMTARSVIPKKRSGPAKGPHVFIYLIDTLRADDLGVYGAKLSVSPRIDEFARDAVLFERAWSTSSFTLPATVSLLSGVYPAEHGMLGMDSGLPDGIAWLPEILAREGYESLGVLQWPLVARFGLERGFESLPLDVRLGDKSHSELARGLFWQQLTGRYRTDRPIFGYIHVPDPHAAYTPQGEDLVFANRFPGNLPASFYSPHVFMANGYGKNPSELLHLRALYDGEVHYADRQFGAFVDLLKFLGLYEDSLIALVSDHGEEFYEHGGFDHARTLYEEVVRVPLIVKFPRSRGAGTRVWTRVSILDILPTVLDAAGKSPDPYRLHGRLLPAAEPAPGATPRTVFAQVMAPTNDLKAIAAGDLKCIHTEPRSGESSPPSAPRLEAFDLSADPGERHPLPESDPRFGRCIQELKLWVSRTKRAEANASPRGRTVFTPEEINKLRSLGYLR